MFNLSYDRVDGRFEWFGNDGRSGERRPALRTHSVLHLKTPVVTVVEALARIPDDEVRAYVANALGVLPFLGEGTPREWPALLEFLSRPK